MSKVGTEPDVGVDVNGETEGLDPEAPDLQTLAGVLIRTRSEVLATRREVVDARNDVSELRGIVEEHGETLRRLARALGVEPAAQSIPPIRKELDSLHEVDKAITGRVSSVEEDQRVIKVSLVEGLPKIVKVLGAVTAAILGLTTVIWQIWSAMRP